MNNPFLWLLIVAVLGFMAFGAMPHHRPKTDPHTCYERNDSVGGDGDIFYTPTPCKEDDGTK